ncbi:MAG: DNA translocase FtsK [Bacteroidia bacterium]
MANQGNTFKNSNKRTSGKKKSSKRRFNLSFKGGTKWVRVGGILMVTIALILLIAFTSFFFTGQADHSQATVFSWDDFRNANPEQVRNWLGSLGAWLSYIFIYRWFGIASYLFIPVIFLLGFRMLFGFFLVPFFRMLYVSLFFIFWISFTLGLVTSGPYDFLAGGFGYHAQLWMRGLLGMAGAIIFSFITLLGFLMLAFNLQIPEFRRKSKLQPDGAPGTANQPDTFGKEYDMDSFKTPETEDREEAEADGTIEDLEEETKEEEFTLKVESKAPKQIPKENEQEDLSLEIAEVEEDELVNIKAPSNDYDPTLDLSNYRYPTLDLLEDHGEEKRQIDPKELEQRKDLIVGTLRNYNIEIDKIKAAVGPTVTLYEIIPAAGVRISKIKNLEDDIALSLAALGIRIIAPIPGRGTIGIEVPNQHPEMVSMRSVISSAKFQNTTYDLPIVLGKTISNEVFVTDLTKMPHLLMAGATGQGKSVGLNAIITSLLYKKHPSQIKFVLVDPKKVELTLYRRIEKHFLAKLPNDEESIITDTKLVVNTLNSLCIEMDKRYDLLKDALVRNIKEYNTKFIARKLNPQKGHRYLPYIVLVIDELADLMMTAGKEVELPIARLAQLARAIGIHLILATQRPSVNIITGTIKANFPARLAFRVTSKIDSRTILDAGGAEQLIGRGDMLFSTGGDLLRLQCPFVDTPEVEVITNFIGDQQGYAIAHQLPEVEDEGSSMAGDIGGIEDWDEFFEDAAHVVVQNQQGSTSLIQRRMKLGYNRAGRIMDQLEAAGIVGQNEGSKAREVLIPDEYALDQLLTNLRSKT